MDQETQRKVMEFSMLEEERKKLEEQLQAIAQQNANFLSLKENLKDIEKHEGEFFASVGSGVFMKSKLLDNKQVLINVGAGIIVEKDSKEAQKIVDRQMKKLNEVKEEVEKHVEKNFGSLVKLEGELRNLVQKNEKKSTRAN